MNEAWEPHSIAVVGAGAIGSLFGGLLQEGGLDVTLIDIWEEHIRAIQEDGLDVHYQAIVDLAGNRIVGIEALVRWQHPKLGSLAPSVSPFSTRT